MNFRNILVIAKWEIKRSKPKFGLNVTILTLLLFISFITLFLLSVSSPSTGQALYSVGISGEDRIIKSVLEYDGRFRLVNTEDGGKLLERGELDLLVVSDEGTRIIYTDSKRSLAALDALSQALRLYKTLTIFVVDEEHINYAFPLWIQTHYLKRSEEFQFFTSAQPEKQEVSAAVESLPDKTLNPKSLPSSEVVDLIEEYRKAGFDIRGITQEEARITLPAIFSPPLPFKSVLLTFLLAFPIYLFSQFYSSSMLEERVNRRAELLLTSPLSAGDVIIGKTLAHFLLTLVSVIAITLIIRRKLEVEIIFVLIPVVLFFLSLSFMASILSRSYKENSFIVIFVSVIFFSFLFFPAMFVNIHTVSNISPVSMIVNIMDGEKVEFSKFIFTTLPLFAMGTIIFFMGAIMFREEVLFSQKGIFDKIFYCINLLWEMGGERLISGVFFGILAAMTAYMLELIFIVALFQVPLPLSLYLMLTLSAFSEEIIKIAFVAGVVRYSVLSAGKTLLLGASCGVGFFIGEKLIALVALAQISGSLFGIFFSEYLLNALLLHVVLTSIAALGLVWSRGRINWRFLFLLTLSGVAHLLYNYSLIGGGA